LRANHEVEALVLVSGGIDSAACAHLLATRNFKVKGVFLDYGQAAAHAERRAVEALTARMNLPLEIISVHGASAFSTGELGARNAFLIFSAIFLMRQRSGLVAIGIHAGTPYFDCSPSFLDSTCRLVSEHFDGGLVVVAPFITWNKGDVFQYFLSAGLPLDLTYSCEAGTEPRAAAARHVGIEGRSDASQASLNQPQWR
jgi:7-cyano-7-deazaguanine synthase